MAVRFLERWPPQRSAESSKKHSNPSTQRLLRRLLPLAVQQRGLIALAVFFMLVEIGLSLVAPWPLKFVIDHITGDRPDQPTQFLGIALDSKGVLAFAAVGVVAVAALRAAAAYINQVSIALVGSRILTEVRRQLYHHLQMLPLSFHNRVKTGDILNRLTGDVNRVEEVAITAILPLTIHALTLVGMMILMLVLNSRLAMMAMIALPLFALTTNRLSGRIQRVAREQRKREGAMAALAAEAMGAIKVVQALSLEKTLEDQFSKQNKKNFNEGARGKRLSARLEGTVDTIVALGTALVLWQGAQMVLGGELTPGELLVFISYLKSGLRPLQDLAKYTSRIAKAAASGERVLDILETVPEIQDRPDAIPAPRLTGRVDFRRVNFSYTKQNLTLKELDLTVYPSEHVALVGPSGAGKSTLVSLLLRLYDPMSGQICADGTDIRAFTLNSLRGQISVVLQDSVLFGVSVRENIAYGRLGATEEEIIAAAKLANAHDFITALPEGYSTRLGERGATLSGGERQRIAIARAAVRNAPILILDEPTSGLDKENERLVIDALKRLMRGCTTFTIAHNLHTIVDADMILYMDGGRVTESGQHLDLLRLNGAYARLYRLQALLTQQSVLSLPPQSTLEMRHALDI